jgi:hypothetical protein
MGSIILKIFLVGPQEKKTSFPTKTARRHFYSLLLISHFSTCFKIIFFSLFPVSSSALSKSVVKIQRKFADNSSVHFVISIALSSNNFFFYQNTINNFYPSYKA